MKRLIIIVFILSLFCCSRVSVPSDVKKILKKNCDSCHRWNNFIKIKSNNKKHWEEVLQRMIRKGARLNNEEYEKLLKYFTKNYSD